MFLLLSLITDLFIGAFLVKGVIRQDPLFFEFKRAHLLVREVRKIRHNKSEHRREGQCARMFIV